MALTKKMLKAMNLEDAQIEQIFEAHEESINALREDRDTFKADAEKYKKEAERLGSVEKDLVKANAKLEEASKVEQELSDLRAEYSKYKDDVKAEAVTAKKDKLYRALLTKAGIPEKRHDAILKVTDLEAVELDGDEIKNVKELSESIDNVWSDFKVTETKRGADVPNPPSNNGGDTFENMSLADKMTYANDNPDSPEVKAWLGK